MSQLTTNVSKLADPTLDDLSRYNEKENGEENEK